MRPADWYLTDNVAEFLGRADDFLRARPGWHVMQSTWAERVRARGAPASGEGGALFGVLAGDGAVRGSCYRLPSHTLGLSPLSAAAADALAARLAAAGHAVRAVTADEATAAAFAEAWQRHTGASSTLRATRLRLYQLGTLTPPQPPPAGRARTLDGERDLAQLIRWCGEFANAVGEAAPTDATSWAGSRFADKRYTLWETPDGTPVSVAGRNPLIGGQVQVDIVYTPARLRGHGYAGAAVAAVSRAALAAGAREVVLFADRANPASNALYQRLGYRTLADWAAYDFAVPRQGAAAR